MKTTWMGTLMGVALALAAVGTPSLASAAGTRTFHGSACTVISGTPVYTSAGQVGNASSSNVVLWCPIVTDAPISTPLTVDGWCNGNMIGTISVQVCTTPSVGGASACVPNPPTNTFGGSPHVCNQTVLFPPSGPSDSSFALITLFPAVGTGQNTLFGYHFNIP